MMEAFIEHLIKSSGILFLFLGSYHAFLKRETFFISNRLFLIAGLLTASFLPFIHLTKIKYVVRAPMLQDELTSISSAVSTSKSSFTFDWTVCFLTIYLLGVVYFAVRLLLQLRSIQKIKKSSEVIVEDKFYHVRTSRQISPFSFFKHIFYHPRQFSAHELKTIISHEKVHALGLHSIDILLAEIVCILQWFNPAIWFYKTIVKQNLEFLADSKTCHTSEDKRNYQYLMLKHATKNHSISIVNPFFNSIIKKRIVMLNQNQSKRINLLKLLIILPILGIFLVGFNTKEVIKFSKKSELLTPEHFAPPTFDSPIKQRDILKISSAFGPAKNPFSNKMENHLGIDLVAKIGKGVSASANGIVKISAKNDTNGNYVVLEHEDGYSTKYMHMKDRSVSKGDKVKSGELIGHVGNTGKSTGTHLHFEILKSGKAINPGSMVPFDTVQKQTVPKKTGTEKSSKIDKPIELIINKDTSDEELANIKKDLAKDEIDFSYTVVHNQEKEIIEISVKITGKGENGVTFNSAYTSSNKDTVITPLVILIDKKNNLVSVGSKGSYKPNTFDIHTGDDHIWVSSDNNDHKEIRIQKRNGKKIFRVNGKEVSSDDLEDMEIHSDGDSHVYVSKHSKNDNNVFIHSDSNDDHDIQVISKRGNGFFFINTEGEKEPIYFVDGTESSPKKVKKLDPNDIESIDVSKGEKAIKKYGKKAKDGVVQIITKKN